MPSEASPNPTGGAQSSRSEKMVYQRPMSAKIAELIHKLKDNCPFFSEMHEREIEEFVRLCRSESFQQGETIFEKGQDGDKIYLVVSGEVLILLGGSEIRLGPGHVFGEMAILDNESRTATAKADSDIALFTMSRAIFSAEMVGLRSKIAVAIAKQLSEKLRNANETIHQISSLLLDLRKSAHH